MIAETRQSRAHLHYEYHRHKRHRRRHHTLDNSTLDKFNFICIPLNPDESRTDSSSSHTNLTMTQSKQFSTSTTPVLTSPVTTTLSTASRRVRFKFDDNDKNRSQPDLNNNRHTRSSDDVRLSEKNSIHRVEFEIPIQRDTNPWFNIDLSSPAKTRSLTSKKIEIKHTPSMRVQNIAPYIEAEIASHTPAGIDYEKSQSQWYRQLYGQLHKPFEMKKDHSQNPYKPTYTFPDEFNGDLDLMEDYIRKKASQTADQTDQQNSSSTIRTSALILRDPRTSSKRTNSYVEKVTRFDDSCSSPIISSSNEQTKSNHDNSTGISSTSSSTNNTLYSNTHDTSPSDNEQKSIYKRILRGGEIPTNGLQKLSNNNREFCWHGRKTKKKSPNVTNESSEQQVPANRYDIIDLSRPKQEQTTPIPNRLQPIYKALALHSFYAQSNKELSFKKGDIVLVLRRINDDWLEGEFQGSIGIFPLNHVELFPIENNNNEDQITDYEEEHEIEGEAIVKYDFIPQKTFELQLRKGDKVILLRKIDKYWYEGRLNHIEGIFPAAYVETLREPADILSQKSHRNGRAYSPQQVSRDIEEIPREKTNTIPNLSLPLRKCQVLYDYTPQNPDELEIHVGDIISILEMCDDGWYCGMMEKSQYPSELRFGTFPGNYVKLLP